MNFIEPRQGIEDILDLEIRDNQSHDDSFYDLHFSESHKVLQAEAKVRAIKVAWAKHTTKRLQGGVLKPNQKKFPNFNVVNFLRAAGEYCNEVHQYNKKHPNNPNPKKINQNLLKFPSLTGVIEDLEKFPVRKSKDDRGPLAPLPLVGEIFNSKNIKLLSPDGKPTAISVAHRAALCSQEVLAHYQPEVDAALRANDALDCADAVIGALEALLIMQGDTRESEESRLAAEIEFRSIILQRSRELLTEKLNGNELAETKNNVRVFKDQESKQKDALAKLGLLSGVSIADLQKKLVELGPQDNRVIEFLNSCPQATQEPLRKLLSSQHRLEKEAEAFNAQLTIINDERQKGTGTAETVIKARKALANLEQWNARVGKLPAETSQSAGSTAAAVAAATTILDETKDWTAPDVLKDKISKPVKDASKKDDPLAAAAAEAGQKAGEQALAQARDYFAGAKSDLATGVALSSLAIADHFLAMNPKTLSAIDLRPEEKKSHPNLPSTEEKKSYSSFPSMNDPTVVLETLILRSLNGIISITPQILSELPTFTRYLADDLRQKMASALTSKEQSQRANGHLIFTEGTVLGNALYLALRMNNVSEANARVIVHATVQHYTQTGQFDEAVVQREMTGRGIGLTHAGLVVKAGQTALTLTKGAKESRAAISNAENEVVDVIKKKLGFSNGLAKTIGNRIHNLHLNGDRIDDAAVNAIVKQEIKRTNHVIAKIYNANSSTNTGKFEFKKDPNDVLLTQALLDIANHYKDHGELERKTVVKILTSHLKKEPPLAWLPEFKSADPLDFMADVIMGSVREVALSPTQIVAEVPQAFINEPRILTPLDPDISNISTETMAIYGNIPFKAAQNGAEVVGGKTKIVSSEVEKELKAGHYQEAALAATKKLPLGQDFTAAAVTALMTKEVKDANARKTSIREAYARAQSRLPIATVGAIGTSVATAAVKAGIPDFAKPVTSMIVDDILNGRFTASNVAEIIANAGEYDHALANIAYITADPNNLDIQKGDYTDQMKSEINDKLMTHYFYNGLEIGNDQALRIINQVINAENARRQAAGIAARVPQSTRCNGFDNIHGARLPSPRDPKICEPLMRVAYRTYVLTTSTKAVQNAQAVHKDEDKNNPNSNFREVAAAVVAAGIAAGLTQKQALKLAGTLTAHYVEKRNFDDLDLTAFQAQIRTVAPDMRNPALSSAAKLLSRAVKGAAKLPEKTEADAVAAGTSVAAEVFPTFKNPEQNSAMAAAIAQARQGSEAQIDNAALYAHTIATTVSPISARFAVAAVSARRDAANATLGDMVDSVVTAVQAIHQTLQPDQIAITHEIKNTINRHPNKSTAELHSLLESKLQHEFRGIDAAIIRDLASATCVGRLIHSGLEAVAAAQGQPSIADQAACAVEAMALAAGMEAAEAKAAGEKTKQAVENSTGPAEAGALTASMISSTPEASQAFAAVVADIVAQDPTLNLNQAAKSQAVTDATAAATVGEDRALPSAPDGTAALQAASQEEHWKKKKALADAEAAAYQDYHAKLDKIEDSTGLTSAMKKVQLEMSTELNVQNAGDWTITEINKYGQPTGAAVKLKDLPEFKDILDDMKELDGFMTADVYAKAVEKFNQEQSQNRFFKKQTAEMQITHSQTQQKMVTVTTSGSREDLHTIFRYAIEFARAEKTLRGEKTKDQAEKLNKAGQTHTPPTMTP